MAVPTPRRRPRRGSLERPVSARIYRAAWIAVAVPLLVAAFSVGKPVALQQPRLPPSFDRTTAVQFARVLAGRAPDRSPGTLDAREAADYVASQLRSYRFTVERQPFTADVPGRGRERFENIVAVAPARPQDTAARSNQTIVVMAHRDNLGGSPGANDNASGTAALLELARNIGTASVAHTIVFVSTDGGAYGGLGAEHFARFSPYADRTIAVINLDAIAGHGSPRVEFAGDTSRSPASPLIASAEASILGQTERAPERPGAGAQLIDLAFPFTLYEQGPFIARGTPAVTITTAGVRPDPSVNDTIATLDPVTLDELGRSAQALLGSLDAAAEVARGTESYIYVGSRLVRGWTVQFLLLAALIPFLAATVDLFARCRRRHIALAPALRSFASRLGVWAWAGLVFSFFAFAGLLPNGEARPIALDTSVAGDWPVLVLIVLASLTTLGWFVARPRLVPRRDVTRSEELGGHLAAMLALGVVALVVAAQNPYALIFVLPSLHAWLWLPHVADRLGARLAVYALGFAGPLLLLGSFAFRFGLGFDAPWYLLALASVGYVPLPLLLAFLAWGAAATQVGALTLGRYAPYPAREERSERGPIRESIRQLVLLTRRPRGGRPHLEAVETEESAES
jgi:Peptidase family M28